MIYINLLPWREQQALESKKEFITQAVIAGALGAVVVAAWFVTAMSAVESQNTVNAKLDAAIKVQEAKITEIKELKDEIQTLLERKKVVESLQHDRNQATRILEQLSLKLPPGVQLKSISQKGYVVRLNGYAQNNSLVSKLMSDLPTSDWFKNPVLVEIKAVDIKSGNASVKASEFTMDVTYVNPEEITLKTVEKKGTAK